MAVPQEKILESTHCNTLQHTATIHFNYNTLQQNHVKILESTHCNTLQHTSTHCNTLPQHTSTATHCNKLVKILESTHCNTLQHTSTHCSTLPQHTSTATHCNILQHACKNFRKSALYPCHVLSKKSCKMNVEFSEFLPAPVVMAVPRVEILKTHLASNFTT